MNQKIAIMKLVEYTKIINKKIIKIIEKNKLIFK